MSDAYRDNVPAQTPAIVALYETQCKNILYRQYGFTDRSLPPPTQLLIAEFDRIKARNEPWWDWDTNTMDLFLRYNISTDTEPNQWCPTILYQPVNWTDPVIKYNPNNDGTFIEWAWNMLQINVTFTNNIHESIYLSLETQQNVNNIPNLINEAYIAEIEPSESTTVLLHVSDVIVVWNTNHEVINRMTINAVDNEIDINSISTDTNILEADKFRKRINAAISFRRQRMWMTRRRYLFNIQIPPIIPKFTELGFDHRKMPQEICEYLTEFYEKNKNKARQERFPIDNPLINAHEVPMHMIHIPNHKKRWIAEIIQPLLEEWTGQQLRYSILYGLREYSHGAVLKGHCDKLETHVVSTILHLKHDPIDIPWPIEVYGFDKQRHYLEDAPCTMTFYESSTLIHGRPSTYNGTSWVNAFLHFRPKTWNYQFTRDNFIVTPEARMPLVDPNKYG